MSLITTTSELKAFCERAKSSPYVTVDTEFIRESSYWPHLCLVQIADKEGAVAVDPLSSTLDLTPLFILLQDPEVIKVFHAARQDIEIFYHLTGQIPNPIFDTQIAAMVCGFGEAASYEVLVNQLLKVNLDKSQRYTNWAQRPLSPRQLKYALGDVIYLREVFEKLYSRVEKKDRFSWLENEVSILTNPTTYTVDPYAVWQKIRYRSAKPHMLAALRELAAWREILAQKKDVPRNRILRDEILLELAATQPKSLDEIRQIRGLNASTLGDKEAHEILNLIQKAVSLPLEDCPTSKPGAKGTPGYLGLLEMLKILLKIKCEQHGVAQKLVASIAELEEIARGEEVTGHVLEGWRRDVFGADALALKAGKLAITVRNNKIELINL